MMATMLKKTVIDISEMSAFDRFISADVAASNIIGLALTADSRSLAEEGGALT